MGEARRRKLYQSNGHESQPHGMSPKELPVSHYEWIRANQQNMFTFLETDLERLKRGNLRAEEILPPKSSCNEDEYVSAYARFLRTQPAYQAFFRSDSGIQALMHQIVREYRCVLAYEHAGRKTYYVSEGLTEGLCCTTLNAPCSSFKLPVECIQLVYANPYAREATAALAGAANDTKGVLADTVISVYVREDNLNEIGFRRLLIVGFERRGSENIRVISRQLALKDDWSLEQALRTDWNAPGVQSSSPPEAAAGWMASMNDDAIKLTGGDASVFLDEGLMFARLVVNTVLYITSRNAELAEKIWPRPISPPVIHDPGRDSSTTGGTKHWTLVGEHVDPVPIIIDPHAKHEPGTGLARQSLRYKVRFLVPGFYRRKPDSPPNAPKDVWVRPHHRGPEMADVVSNPYIVR